MAHLSAGISSGAAYQVRGLDNLVFLAQLIV